MNILSTINNLFVRTKKLQTEINIVNNEVQSLETSNHPKNKDTKLDEGGTNEVTAATIVGHIEDTNIHTENLWEGNEVNIGPKDGKGIIVPAAKMGTVAENNNNYTEFDEDGFMKMIGKASCFRDELGDITKIKATGTRIVDNVTESGVDYQENIVPATDYQWCNIQRNHDAKLTATIYPHFHWFQVTSGVPNILLYYRWQSNGGDKETNWTPLPLNHLVFPFVSNTKHQILANATGITPPEGSNVSDIIQFRITRDATNSTGVFAGQETAGTITALSFDAHVEVDTHGSNTQYSKYLEPA